MTDRIPAAPNASDIERAAQILREFCGPAYLSDEDIRLHAPRLAAALAAARQEEQERAAQIVLTYLASENGADGVEIAAAIREAK